MTDQAAIDDVQNNDFGNKMINLEQPLPTLENKIAINDEEKIDSVSNKNPPNTIKMNQVLK